MDQDYDVLSLLELLKFVCFVVVVVVVVVVVGGGGFCCLFVCLFVCLFFMLLSYLVRKKIVTDNTIFYVLKT